VVSEIVARRKNRLVLCHSSIFGKTEASLQRASPIFNLHHRVWMLWASSCLDGLLTPEEKRELTSQILAKQQSNGGRALRSLGDFARKGVTQITAPDGYATGLVGKARQSAFGGSPSPTRETPLVSPTAPHRCPASGT
jgi:hypothetical protein